MPADVSLAHVRAAAAALAPHLHRTPLLRASALGRMSGADLYLKAENLQRTGSFKVRGAFNRIRQLREPERRRGVVASSAGNHGQGVALAARELGVAATVVMPEGAPLIKVESTRAYGAEVVLHGRDFDQAYRRACAIQAEHGATLVHAFDDPAVVTGQGTVGLELLEQLPEVEAVLVPVGGGGLIAGVATVVKELRPAVRVIGVQASAAPAAYRSWREGRLVAAAPGRTLADGLAVKAPGGLTWQLIRRTVDDMVTVNEDEIAGAIVCLLERAKLVAEGAAAAAVAAAIYGRVPLAGRRVAVVLSGGNIDLSVVARVIDRGMIRSGRLLWLVARVADRPGALRSLLGVVASEGANVVTVDHDRLRPDVPVGEAEVRLLVETRDQEQARRLVDAVRAAGYDAGEGPKGHL